MKNTKKVILGSIVTLLMPLSGFTKDVDPLTQELMELNEISETAMSTSENKIETKQSNNFWEKHLKNIKNAKLDLKLSLPTINLANGGVKSGSSYEFKAGGSIGGNYAGVDVWKTNISVFSKLFGIDLPGDLNLGISAGREITFIQQFKTQKEAFLRVPYDPITKIPISHKHFLTESGKKEAILKPGDFIAFRAPLSFSIGKILNGELLSKIFSNLEPGYLGSYAKINWILSGEFDVNIFVMDDRRIRVRVLTSKKTQTTISAGVKIMGLDTAGKIVSSIFNPKLLTVYASKADSDLYLADYIFNMNDREVQGIYDHLVGHKMKLFDKTVFIEELQNANPFISDEAKMKTLFKEASRLNEISDEDLNKPNNQKRIVKLLNAKNQMDTSAFGVKLSFLQLFQFRLDKTISDSKITVYGHNLEHAADYRMDAFSTNKSFQFAIWGEKLNIINSMLAQIKTDDKGVEGVSKFVGLQNSKIFQDKVSTLNELTSQIEKIKTTLPEEIFNKLEMPQWKVDHGQVQRLYLQQDITFNTNLFNIDKNISEEHIRKELIDIIENSKIEFKSRPLSASYVQRADEDFYMKAFNSNNYLRAYGYYIDPFMSKKGQVIEGEVLMIPKLLSFALKSKENGEELKNFAERYKAFMSMYENIPLFNEICTELLLKVIPPEDLNKILNVRILLSARKQQSVTTQYPANASSTGDLFREILAQNAYVNSKSYDMRQLRQYISEKGIPYSLDEILKINAGLMDEIRKDEQGKD